MNQLNIIIERLNTDNRNFGVKVEFILREEERPRKLLKNILIQNQGLLNDAASIYLISLANSRRRRERIRVLQAQITNVILRMRGHLNGVLDKDATNVILNLAQYRELNDIYQHLIHSLTNARLINMVSDLFSNNMMILFMLFFRNFFF